MKEAIEYLEKMLLIVKEDNDPSNTRDYIRGYEDCITDLKHKANGDLE